MADKNCFLKKNSKKSACNYSHDIAVRNFFPGKFSAPRIDSEFHLIRKKAIAPLIHTHKRVTLITAQAGQGKSIFAAQSLQHINAEFIWIQLDAKDKEPSRFLAAVTTALGNFFPDFAQTKSFCIDPKEKISRTRAGDLAFALVKDIAPLLKKKIYLAIDDLDILAGSRPSMFFLNNLILNAPDHLSFILISRATMALDDIFPHALRFDNSSLAFSQGEVAELFTGIFKTPLSADVVADIHRYTEGWAIGLILLGSAYADSSASRNQLQFKKLPAVFLEKIYSYFRTEISSFLSPIQRRILIALGLLEDIPLHLAEAFAFDANMLILLEHFVQNNLFIKRIENNPPAYAFHLLFREFLRKMAAEELCKSEQRRILAKSGHWYLRQGKTEQALHYYLNAKVYSMVEKILRDKGLHLIYAYQSNTIKAILENIPTEIARSRPWFLLCAAVIQATSASLQAKTELYQVYQKFIEQNDEIGKLFSIASLIYFHATIDCSFKEGARLLPKAEALYAALPKSFPIAPRIMVAGALAYGSCCFTGQFKRATEYAGQMITMAKEINEYDAMATGVLIQGVICSLHGNWQDFKNQTETFFSLLHSPLVNDINKLGLRVLQICLLGQEGDFAAGKIYRQKINNIIDPKLIGKPFFESMLIIFDACEAALRGNFEDALGYLHRGISFEDNKQSLHIQSIYWGRVAYLLAAEGKINPAMEALEKSALLRKESGGVYFEISNKILMGSVYALLGAYTKTEMLLSEALAEIKEFGRVEVKMMAYAHRGFARLNSNRLAEGLTDVECLLTVFKFYQYPIYHIANPLLMKQLLTAAAMYQIKPREALLASKKLLGTAITPEGRHIPLLEIKTFGKLEIKINGEVKITFSDFTKIQRELLALLISMPIEKGVSCSVIQNIFWPESSVLKIRSKLDNLFARLRKVFNTRLMHYSANDYLFIEKGVMGLKNCSIDVDLFQKTIQRGFRHMRKKELWQAGNAFLNAHLLYEGEFLPGITLNDPVAYFREELQSSFIKSSLSWVKILIDQQKTSEAISICRKALAYDPSNEKLVKSLHTLLIKNRDTVGAIKVAANYIKILAEDGFSSIEINKIIASFKC